MIGSLDALLAATVLFVGGHFILSGLALRRPLTNLLGDRGFRIVYALIALVAFAWMLAAYRAAPVEVVWSPPTVLAWVPLVVMPVALLLVVCGVTTPSTTMVGGEAHLNDPAAHDPTPGIMRITRHPFLWGTSLWAASHLLVNGDAAGIILMGGILVLSLGGMKHIDLRREASLGSAWGPVKLITSILPFAAVATGRTTIDWPGIGWWRPIMTLVIYAVLLLVHPWFIGVSALPA